jgi:hypothetical protein
MSKLPLILAAAGGAALLLRSRKSSAMREARPVALERLSYETDPLKPWGRTWGATRPPDLPPEARRSGIPGSATAAVSDRARAEGIGPDFVRMVSYMAENESHATFGAPARRPYPSAAGWGVFQFNRTAWRAMSRRHFGCLEVPDPLGPREAWETTPEEEIGVPIRMYACLWNVVLESGGGDADAARGVSLWHSGSSYFRAYLAEGRGRGFPAAVALLGARPPSDAFADKWAKANRRLRELGIA